jgi:hypothetical protein
VKFLKFRAKSNEETTGVAVECSAAVPAMAVSSLCEMPDGRTEVHAVAFSGGSFLISIEPFDVILNRLEHILAGEEG